MKKIKSALISVFYKDGIDTLAQELIAQDIKIYSTGGTLQFLTENNIPCTAVEEITNFPSVFGGRVKTLHPKVFGGILYRRAETQDQQELQQHEIPTIDLVIVDLYPFEETLASTNKEKLIIEKIDIGGPSMIRAAAKNFADVCVLASKDEYDSFGEIIKNQLGETSLEQRKHLAAKAFEIVKHYDIAISDYFNPTVKKVLRYGENPHQSASFEGNFSSLFEQLNGKELSYNNLVDVDAALQLMQDFNKYTNPIFAIIKHTNVCGCASRTNLIDAWKSALAGDPESAFGGILISNTKIDIETAQAINELFFEVLLAPNFDIEALELLKSKKNRILLQTKNEFSYKPISKKSMLNGTLVQQYDDGNFTTWQEVGGRPSSDNEKQDLIFANIICKHLKSNAIALVKNQQLIGKGCGQTSRIDALKQCIEKASYFEADLKNAILASDAFFPFDDCVKIAFENGIETFIQPGGSIRDKDSIDFCKENNLAMVLTEMRHFKH